jgi:hypothetical protein
MATAYWRKSIENLESIIFYLHRLTRWTMAALFSVFAIAIRELSVLYRVTTKAISCAPGSSALDALNS